MSEVEFSEPRARLIVEETVIRIISVAVQGGAGPPGSGGSGGALDVRVVTGGGDIAGLDGDRVVIMRKDLPEPTTYTLPDPEDRDQPVTIKDLMGAATNNITVLPFDGETIDGGAGFVLDMDHQAVTFNPYQDPADDEWKWWIG